MRSTDKRKRRPKIVVPRLVRGRPKIVVPRLVRGIVSLKIDILALRENEPQAQGKGFTGVSDRRGTG